MYGERAIVGRVVESLETNLLHLFVVCLKRTNNQIESIEHGETLGLRGCSASKTGWSSGRIFSTLLYT